MQIKKYINLVLNGCLTGNYSALEIIIPIYQHENSSWCLIKFRCAKHIDKTVVKKDLCSAVSKNIQVKDGAILGLLGSQVFYEFREGKPREREGYLIEKLELPRYMLDNINIEELLNSVKQDFFVFKYRKEVAVVDIESIEEEIRSKTWLKAEFLPLFLRNSQLKLLVGSQSKHIILQEQQPLGIFESEDLKFIAFIHESSSKNLNKIKVSVYQSDGCEEIKETGIMDFFESINFNIYFLYGVRIKSPIKINIFSKSDDFDFKLCLSKIYSYIEDNQKINSFLKEYIESEKFKLVQKIEYRKSSLKQRKKIFFTDSKSGEDYELGFEPTNEKELIILASKLEKEISRTLGFFKIIEHTSQVGIDGLITIRKTPSSLLEECVTVEFEYSLSNFFKHEHPIHQTRYIICWNIGNIDSPKSLRIPYKIHEEDWKLSLIFYDHIIDVLPLYKLPGLIFR